MSRETGAALGLGALAVASAGASILAIAVASHAVPAEASSRTAGVIIELTPEADTWFEVDVGTGAPVNPTPQGASQGLQAGWSDVGIEEYALVRFALPAGLAAKQVLRAELELHVGAAAILSYGPPLPVSGTLSLALGHVLQGWDESTASSLAPPKVASVGLARHERQWHPCQGDECGRALVDVTPLVRDWLDGDAQPNGLALHASGSLQQQPVMGVVFTVASRESGHPPILRISRVEDEDVTPGPTTATPEPTTARPPSATATSEQATARPPSPIWLPLAFRPATRSAPTPGPTPTASRTPSATPGTGRYLLVERWTDAQYGPGCPGMAIDFPTYWFDESTGVLRIWASLNPSLEPDDVGYYASGVDASGRVIGTSSGLLRIESLPTAFEDDRVVIESVDDSGAVALAYAGEDLELAPGGRRQWRTVGTWRDPGCVVTSTVRISNFGYQDRSNIVYY